MRVRTYSTPFLKVIDHVFKNLHFSKTCTFQKLVFFKNLHFSKTRTFQKLALFKNSYFSKTCTFQKHVFFKNTYFQKYVLFKITYFQKLRPFSSETRVFKAHSSYASILKCLSITGESLMFG